MLNSLDLPAEPANTRVVVAMSGGVDSSVAAALVRDACAAGTRVVWRRYPGLDHGATVTASLADSLPFARRVLAGQEVASNCPNATGSGDAAQR